MSKELKKYKTYLDYMDKHKLKELKIGDFHAVKSEAHIIHDKWEEKKKLDIEEPKDQNTLVKEEAKLKRVNSLSYGTREGE